MFFALLGCITLNNICVKAQVPLSHDKTFELVLPTMSWGITQLLVSNPDGSYLLYGDFRAYSGMPPYDMIKFLPNGALATNFNWEGNNLRYFQKAPYGYLIQEGLFSPLIKVSPTGTVIDSSFMENQTNSTFPATDGLWFGRCYLAPDGYIWKGGLYHQRDTALFPNLPPTYNLFRLTPQGAYDYSFTKEVNQNAKILNILPYTDSLLFITGYITTYDSVTVDDIFRVDLDGNLDTSFHSPFIGHQYVFPIYADSLGRMFFTGTFTLAGFTDTLTLVRLWPDGSLDTTFNNTGYTYHNPSHTGIITTICPTSDGGYLMGGRFHTYDGYARHHIVKTDANGYIDANYFNGSGFELLDTAHYNPSIFAANVSSILPGQSEDVYYIAGLFDTYNGEPVQPIIRLHGMSVGLEPEVSFLDILVYPNPTRTYTTFQWQLAIPAHAPVVIRITDITGRIVATHSGFGAQGSWLWDTRNVPNGIYLYSLFGNNRQLAAGKVVVQQ